MNITDMYNASRSNAILAQSYARQTSTAPSPNTQEADKTQKSFNYSDVKAQQKVASTNEQISNLGKVKSSFSDAQSAAQDMQKLKANASSDEMAAAANKMVSAYNNTLKTASGSGNGTNADSVEARRAGTQLRAEVTAGGLSRELQNAGFSVAQDGSVKVDQDKFKAAAAQDPEALRKALDQMGNKVERSSSKALDDKGELTTSINNLKKNAADLEAKKSGNSTATASQSASSNTSTVSLGRYVSPTEMANNAEKTIEAYNKKIKAGGATAANAAKEFAGSDRARELAKSGITRNDDGTLSMDRDKFRAAALANSGNVRATMDKVASAGSQDPKATSSATSTSSTTATTQKEQAQLASNQNNSAEARRKEQEQFEANLNKKYQSFNMGSNGQRLGFMA
jgi:hypothetical protein